MLIYRNVNIKKLHPDAVIPSYAKAGDAGMDLTAISMEKDSHGNVVYGTGLAIEIPEGYVGLIFPRSSNSKTDLYLTNHVGVIDSGYRGEIQFKFRANPSLINARIYHLGDRIGQLIIIPYPGIQFVEVDVLSDTERGTGGFGSTGK
jgi:dUTP pyrophosphatase